MLTTNQKLWVDALRSGDYQQATNTLESNRGGSFCCLGVACRVAEKHGVKIHVTTEGTIEGDSLEDQPEVKEWLGIKHDCGQYDSVGESLTYDNDTLGLNFKELADTIEAKAYNLFER